MNVSRRVPLALAILGLVMNAAPAQEQPSQGAGSVIGGAALYLVKPYYENNTAYHLLQEGVKPEFRRTDRVDVRQHLSASPVVWLGYVGTEGLGGRVRYWDFRQDTDQLVSLPRFTGAYLVEPNGNVVQKSGILSTVTSAAPLGLQAFGDTLSKKYGPEATNFTVTTQLQVQVLDLEGLLDFEDASWSLRLSGGVRLARLEQEYNVTDEQSTSPRLTRRLLSDYRFEGAGPVLGAEGRLPVGETGFATYGLARGAIVFGKARQQASFGGLELRNDDPNPQVAFDRRHRSLAIGEMEFGLEYHVPFGAARFSGQVGVVGQGWRGAGNASHSTNLTLANAPPAVGGAASEADLAFLGLVLRFGLDY